MKKNPSNRTHNRAPGRGGCVTALVLLLLAGLLASLAGCGKTEPETESPTDPPVSQATETETESETESEVPTETEPPETAETLVSEAPEPVASVKQMIRIGLTYVSRSLGYSLTDRTGANGHFDCSGLVAVLLREGLGEQSIGWFSDGAWDTAYWRYFCSLYQNGDRIRLGSALYEVRMKECYDYEKAWEIPGSIVVQYPPENDGSVKSGHISVALGAIPYESVEGVRNALFTRYGVDLGGFCGNDGQVPMIYDQYGPGSGHITWRLNANGFAKAVCVDNNYSSDPSWVERIAAVFVPVEE